LCDLRKLLCANQKNNKQTCWHSRIIGYPNTFLGKPKPFPLTAQAKLRAVGDSRFALLIYCLIQTAVGSSFEQEEKLSETRGKKEQKPTVPAHQKHYT
jgi:hypothetical protein